MAIDSWQLVVLLGVSLVISGAFFRVLFFGIELDEDDAINYGYSFTNIWRSIESMLNTMGGGNFPDFLINAYKINYFYTFFIYVYNFIAGSFIFGFFAGGIGENYMGYYTLSLRRVAAKYPYV